ARSAAFRASARSSARRSASVSQPDLSPVPHPPGPASGRMRDHRTERGKPSMTPPAAANGTHVLTPEFVALLRHRELADATAAATADAPQPRREPPSLWRRQHLDGDTVIRIVAASAVLGVAIMASREPPPGSCRCRLTG